MLLISQGKFYGDPNMFALMLLSEGVPNTSLVWLLYVTLAFMFLMIIVGWLTSRKEQDQSEVQHEAKMPAKKDAELMGERKAK
jgi:hypothetical protein